MTRYLSTPAVVINRQKKGEGDLSITLFTPETGKTHCIAKGAQSIRSRRLGHLEIGNIIQISLYQKNGYYWVSETETKLSFLQNSPALTQINLLFYFLEIANQLLPSDQSNPNLFPILVQVITAINQNHFHSFIKSEITFLEKLGYGVPHDISDSYQAKDYRKTQSLLKNFYESIIERPLLSNKLFS